MKPPTQIDEHNRKFLQDRDYLAETTYDANQLSIFVQENEQKITNQRPTTYIQHYNRQRDAEQWSNVLS